jgi:2-keto-4-pentenoate hydratase/2-oxohepta-3-ene-1,7-dioic acid hydratase in catechol pathway
MPSVLVQGHPPREVEIRNIFCIGRNYAAHIAELGNRAEETPVVFLKPTSALSGPGQPIHLPQHSKDVHYETELVLLIGAGGKSIPLEEAYSHIEAYGLGLDLTARDLQSVAKQARLPWAVAKGFDCAATVTEFVPADLLVPVEGIQFEMHLNDVLKQQGDTRNMLFSIPEIISYLSSVFTLQAGDLVFTGTPEGVGSLSAGDIVKLNLTSFINSKFTVFD